VPRRLRGKPESDAFDPFTCLQKLQCDTELFIYTAVRSSPAVAGKEPIVRSCLDSGIALQRAALVRNMVLMYSPAGSNIYGSRGCEFEEIGSV